MNPCGRYLGYENENENENENHDWHEYHPGSRPLEVSQNLSLEVFYLQ